MANKITLITPPDVFENQNLGLFFAHISKQDQEIVSKWLANHPLAQDLNFYIFSGESDATWFFLSLGICKYKYFDLDNLSGISSHLVGYALSKSDVFYKTQDENLAALYRYVNNNRISSIESFLEIALNAKNS